MLRSASGLGLVVLAAGLVACGDSGTVIVDPPPGPAAPLNLDGWYYARTVNLTWDLSASWRDESFRVYGKRLSDPDYFLIAEVTNCIGGSCTYSDINIVEDVSYNYFVAAVDPVTGAETSSDWSVDVYVPFFTPPPVPDGLEAVGLDAAIYLRWGSGARAADDFSFYRVYLAGDQADFLLGETDSEGFLDELAQNGGTYAYRVSAVDSLGHESGVGGIAQGTPRPDYDNEWVWAYQDVPSLSGFQFTESEEFDPLVDGDSPLRHFRLEADEAGWWLVPGPTAQIHQQGFLTTALKCGPAADFNCVDLAIAPSTGYAPFALAIAPQTTYVLRYEVAGGSYRYGAIRVSMLGTDQLGDRLMIFDWAHQLQPDNRNLVQKAED